MNKACIIYIFIIHLIFYSNSKLLQDQQYSSKLLKGTPISSDSSSQKLSNAFDGDINTEFKSEQQSNGWIGLELDNSYRITKIGWAQKENDKENYLLGIFEGANDPSFFDAIPLTMIVDEGKVREINYIDIYISRSFKYVRYIGPNGKNSTISQLEFYGYKYEESENVGNEEEHLYQPTGIPLIVIHTEGAVEPKDKETDIICQITIINKGKEETNKKGTIKLRGNSTMRSDKNPYKIKFDEKQKLLDLSAKAKKWNLMANHSDKTLLRTLLAMKISILFEMPFTPECRPVDVMVNGEFKGNYNLCDKIELNKNRVQLGDDENIEQEPVDGGFIFEATQYAYKEGYYLNTTRGIILGVRYPDKNDITPEQLDYIHNKLNEVESEAYSGVVDNIDFETFSKYLLVQELCGQSETFWSTYMTKRRNDEKIYFGPVWDFDLAFDNDRRVFSTLNKTNFLFKYDSSAGTMREFAVKLLNNEELLQNVKNVWNEMTEEKVTKSKLLAYVDEQVEIINESQKLNFKRWDILNKNINASPTARCSFKKEIAFLKDYIPKRFDLVNEIVEASTTQSVNEEVDHFDLDLTHQGGKGNKPSGNNGSKHGGNKGHEKSSSIVEDCINFVDED